jgi:NADH-quinone oxidoreductase subunit A
VTAAYLVLFVGVGAVFLWVALSLGRFFRAHAPSAEKAAPYECGEPPIGSSQVRYDLRFYVAALVFLIFEVEVALFFPPAAVFGRATQQMEARGDKGGDKGDSPVFAETKTGTVPSVKLDFAPADARRLAIVTLADLGIFFAVILLGFAYVWRRGDLDWVRAPGRDPANAGPDLRIAG